jgi:hypothetical protein
MAHEPLQEPFLAEIAPGKLDWSRLVMAIPTEALNQESMDTLEQALQVRARARCLTYSLAG